MADIDIESINESWEGHSGTEVENFIKRTFSQKAGTFYEDTDNARYLVFTSEEAKSAYLADTTKTELILGAFPIHDFQGLADEVEQLRANMVMAVEVDEQTGIVSLIYDEDNKTISDAYIDDGGMITIETEI